MRGAVAAGATHVTVNDAHGPMRDLLSEALHPAAQLIRGRPGVWMRVAASITNQQPYC
ncbi:D-aminopeptidase [Streptomyces ambofaciens]